MNIITNEHVAQILNSNFWVKFLYILLISLNFYKEK